MSESVSTTTAERERERDRFIWVFNNCQTRVGLPDVPLDAERKHMWMGEPPTDSATRPLQEEDVKVTVKWSQNPANNELIHLKTIEGNQYFTLGVRFDDWRKRAPEEKLATLGAMVAHTRYPNRNSAYWDFALDIWEEMVEPKTLDALADLVDDKELETAQFRAHHTDDPIDPGYLRNQILDLIYDWSSDTSQREAVISRAEDRLGYHYEWVNTLDWSRKYKGQPAVRTSSEEWAGTATRVEPDRIEFTTRYTDEELVECYDALDPLSERENVFDVPEIHGVEEDDGTIRIMDNEKHAALIARTTRTDGTVPVCLT